MALEVEERQSRVLPRLWFLLGPAFVAAIAYVDPGNVAANLTAGARYGYLLVWVLVAANAIAAGRLATVDLPLPKRRFLALRHKERYLAKAAAAFLAMASNSGR